MVEHHPVMGDLSVLLLDDNPTSLQIISNMLVESGFKVFPFRTVEMALDFIKSRAANEEELDLILSEVHLRNIAPGSLANSELLHYILNKLQVPLITMCAYDDREALSECVNLGACFHVLKPLHAGSLNILRQKALEKKSKKATPQGPIPCGTKSGMVSSSPKRTQEMLILERNSLSNPESNEFEVPEVVKAHGCSKKPGRVKWTIELHERFLDAVEVLGDKFATPCGILKLMDVKGFTLKQIASHLQRHRLRQRKAKQGGQQQGNTSTEPVSELMLIGSAHNASATESITPYPSRLWTQKKKSSFIEAAALKTCTYTCTSGIYRNDTKSVWDEYQMGLQKGFSPSNRRWQQIGLPLSKRKLPAKNSVVVIDGVVSIEAPKAATEIGNGASIESFGSSKLSTNLVDQVGENNFTEGAGNNGNTGDINLLQDGGISSEAPKVAGEIGYGASVGILSTSLVDQAGENNRTEAAGNNDTMGNINLLEGTMNKEHTAAMDPSDPLTFLMTDLDLLGPSDATEEEISNWMSVLEGSQDEQNLGLQEPPQVGNASNTGLTSPSLINIDGSMGQEATAQNAPMNNPVMPIAQDDEFWSWILR